MVASEQSPEPGLAFSNLLGVGVWSEPGLCIKWGAGPRGSPGADGRTPSLARLSLRPKCPRSHSGLAEGRPAWVSLHCPLHSLNPALALVPEKRGG